MKQLCINLPPLAPDYSGVSSALYEMEGMTIIHDASGCTGNYTGFDEPRWYDNQRLVFCSGLREMDAILGDDNKLIQKIVRAAGDLKPKFIALLGSPVPMVIGSDLEGIAKEVEYLTGLPVLGFNTTGLRYYDEGISEAYLKAAKIFLGTKEETVPKSVNLLGVTPLDFSIHQNAEDLQSFFKNNNYRVNACWSMDCDLEMIKGTTRASCNIVVSVSGLKLARYLEKTFQIPYKVGIPIGISGETRILKALKGEETAKSKGYENEKGKILIIGEQVLSNSIRYMLQQEYGHTADVATFFTLDEEYAEKNDFIIDNEMHLIKILKSNKYRTIIGDPLIKELLPDDGEVKFIDLPHVAVSSRIHWKEPIHIIGKQIYKLFNKEREII